MVGFSLARLIYYFWNILKHYSTSNADHTFYRYTLAMCYNTRQTCFIQLNANYLYPFTCSSLCLLWLLILMLTVMIPILIESRSMLIVYWLGNRTLINAYLTKSSTQDGKLKKGFWKIKILFCKIYFIVLKCLCLYIFYAQLCC